MTIYRNTLEGGTDGLAISTANSGGASGNAFTAVASPISFSTEQAHAGSLSMKPSVAANQSYVRWGFSGTRSLAFRAYVYCTTAHTAEYIINRLDVGGNSVVAAVIGSNSMLRIKSGGTYQWTASSTFPLNQWVRIEFLTEIGTSANDGKARLAYYIGESATPVGDSGWINNLSLSGDTGTVTGALFGKISLAAYAGSLYMDTLAVNSDSDYTGFIGSALASNHAPTASAGAAQVVNPGSTVTLDGTGSTDSDAGTTLTYSWSFAWPSNSTPTLTGATTGTPSFVAGTHGSIYNVALQVSDGSLSSTDSVNILVSNGSSTSSGNEAGELVWDGSSWK